MIKLSLNPEDVEVATFEPEAPLMGSQPMTGFPTPDSGCFVCPDNYTAPC
ncbi:MAG TPA: hypothetical protein VFE05_20500 [Longimicrobiaceae bacterium]|nr:hypothetical protein [Longimicrobiaceae bacterium]